MQLTTLVVTNKCLQCIYLDAYCGDFGIALHTGCARGFPIVVQTILRGGVSITAVGGRYGSPMLAAVLNSRVRVVQMLLIEGEDKVEISQDVAVAAARNREVGKRSGLYILLKKRVVQIEIS